jgi:hypothetical protein
MGTVPLNATRASATTAPTTPPTTRSTGEPAHAQPTATTRRAVVSTISGPVPTAPERADTGSATPAATLTAASTARVAEIVAEWWCRRSVKSATTSR